MIKDCRHTNWKDRGENVRKRTYKMRSDGSSDSETSKNKNRDPREVTSNQPATKNQNRGQKEIKKKTASKKISIFFGNDADPTPVTQGTTPIKHCSLTAILETV